MADEEINEETEYLEEEEEFVEEEGDLPSFSPKACLKAFLFLLKAFSPNFTFLSPIFQFYKGCI